MSSHRESQMEEIQALESIYPEIEVLSTEPHYVFTIEVKGEVSKNDTDIAASCTLKFTYVESYPDEPPLIEVEDEDNLDSDEAAEIVSHLNQQAQENLGMVMIFTLVSAGTEKIHVLLEEREKRIQDAKERGERELEELERRKFEGTRVTVESFTAWKLKFNAEMNELKQIKASELAAQKKPTGRQLFERDRTLDESDINFLDDDESVPVDETLFEDVEDFGIDDDDDDDPDFEGDDDGEEEEEEEDNE